MESKKQPIWVPKQSQAVMLNSSNLEAVIARGNLLYVWFQAQSIGDNPYVYLYEDTQQAQTALWGLLTANSAGRYFNQFIRLQAYLKPDSYEPR